MDFGLGLSKQVMRQVGTDKTGPPKDDDRTEVANLTVRILGPES